MLWINIHRKIEKKNLNDRNEYTHTKKPDQKKNTKVNDQ